MQKAIYAEGDHILGAIRGIGYIIALDRTGEDLTSEALADLVHNLEIEGPYQVAWVIGGPHGLDSRVLDQADMVISLSKLTFPHQLARLILFEQIYRAFTIIKGLPYHK